MPELLAPAGNLACAIAAFECGADAVYAGLERFNARERNDNFSYEDFGKLLSYSRQHGKRVYLTLNTLIKEDELADVAEILSEMTYYKPDAIIVQDLGVLRLLREFFPELTIHASTQMGIHNSAGVAVAEKMGVERVILERQVTIKELKTLMAKSNLEIEVFVHGALCCSLSGSCLFSSWLGGWSGNRGRCKQPCRRRFFSKQGNGFFFSSQDLYSLDQVQMLKELKVSSLKIEGRLKNVEYVRNVVTAYRMMLDASEEDAPKVLKEARGILSKSCGRHWSHGFSDEKSMKTLIQHKSPGVSGILCGNVVGQVKGGFGVKVSRRLHIGDRIRLQPETGDEGFSITITAMSVDGKSVNSARKGEVCVIANPRPVPKSFVYKVGTAASGDEEVKVKIKPFKAIVDLKVSVNAYSLKIEPKVDGFSQFWQVNVPFQEAQNAPLDQSKFMKGFQETGDSSYSLGHCEFVADGAYFLPSSELKKIRKEFWQWLEEQMEPEIIHSGAEGLFNFYQAYQAEAEEENKKEFFKTTKHLKRTYCLKPESELPPKGHHIVRSIFSYNKLTDEVLLPFFCGEDKLDGLKKRIDKAYSEGIRRFRITSIFAFELLKTYKDITVNCSFPLPATNSLAVEELADLGADRVQIWVELERKAMEQMFDKVTVPMETYSFGRLPLLLTRAELPVEGNIKDSRGNEFMVKHERGSDIWFVYPKEVMKFPRVRDSYTFFDYSNAHPGEKNIKTFNYEQELV